MEPRLNDDEIACIKKLAELSERGVIWTKSDPPGLATGRREAILAMMQEIGAIVDVQHSTQGRYIHFRIAPKAVQIAREIAEQEKANKEQPRDIVEEIKTTVRGNRILALALIAFFCLVGLVSLLNGLLDLLKKFGWLKGD